MSARSRILPMLVAAVLMACDRADAPIEKAQDLVEESVVEVPADPPGPDLAALRGRAQQVLGELPDEAVSEANPITAEKIALGRMLYFDPRFSANHDISCNSCHDLQRFGVDGEPTSPGHRGQRGERNSPTVLNAALHSAQFWDGRAADVEEQAKGPILNPVEMAMPSEGTLLEVVNSIPGYPPLFAAAFPGEEDPVTYDNFAAAIGAFERRLITADRLDAFVSGQDPALSDRELAGLEEFMNVGCITCHMGPTIGGTMYRKIGLIRPYPTDDVGREAITGNETDRHVFKVPSLRNVEKTGPYFHDGSVETLGEAIRLMGAHQLGVDLDDDQVARIAAFLATLTGTVDPTYIAAPELPASGPDTPAPDPS